MSDDEKTPDVPPDEGADDAAEHELPPPATWAGRLRNEGDAEPSADDSGDDEPGADDPGDDAPGDDAPAESEAQDAGDELRAGFTEEYDSIERDLEAELSASELDELDDEEELAAAEGDEEAEAAIEDEADPTPAAAEGDGDDAGVDDDPGEDRSDLTVEADTLALADRAEAEEAALAGLRARTTQHPTAPSADAQEEDEAEQPAPEPVGVAATGSDADGEGPKPPRAKPVWLRFFTASILIVVSMAAATSISLLLYLTDIVKGLNDNDALASLKDQLSEADGGAPQTILIIGSDKRLGPEGEGDPGRSDTTILLRVDPDKDAIALLSIPRDLKVNIPGYGPGKFNEAYNIGQEDKTLKTVTRLTGLDINHVVNINFTGFADAVDAIGCVYIDVDRRYFIPPEQGISEIDIEAGYQRLCGYKALQYVRFRHEDNDLVRAARQQDFLREARQKLFPSKLIEDRNELLEIFTEYTTSDISEAVPLLELLKTFAAVQDAPVSEVHFPAELGETYVTAGEGAIKEAVEQFLNSTGTPGARPGGDSNEPPEEDKPESDGDKSGGDKSGGGGDKQDGGGDDGQDFVGPPMDDSTALGQQYAEKVASEKKKNGEPYVDFPVYYPTRLAPGSTINEASRAFNIDGPSDDVFYGYKLAVDVPGEAFGNGLLSEYYGVSGTDWVDAPILDNPSEQRVIDGREYLLFYDGDRLRLVGFKTKNAAYWVNNSLSQSLDENQMLSIATSLREFGD